MQGRLRARALSVAVDSACAWCRRALRLEITDRLEWRVRRGPETALVFEPEIDWSSFKAPTIVDDY